MSDHHLVDSHVHFWDPVARHHDWLADVPELNRRFAPADYGAGHHALVGIVFVQADCRDDEALAEARWVSDLAGSDSRIRGIVAYAPVHEGAGVEAHLDALAELPLVVGVRRLLQDGPLEAITDAALIRGVRLLAERQLRFDVCIRHQQLPAVIELAEACADTRFVLDHLGKPPVAAGVLTRGAAAHAARVLSPRCLQALRTDHRGGARMAGGGPAAISRARARGVRPAALHGRQ